MLHIVCERDVGLFNLVLGVISHVHWALSEGRIPIVFFGRNTCYWTPRGYRGSDSVWEYYFEPVVREYPAARIPPHVRQWIADNPRMKGANDEFADEFAFVSGSGAWHVQFDGERVRGPKHGTARRKTRQLASAIVREYIRPRSYIAEKADLFARRHMAGRHVIGVHLRGTDAIDLPGRFVRRPGAQFRTCCAILRRLLRKQPGGLIFVASDTQEIVDRMRAVFGDRVISYDSIRNEGSELVGKGPLGGSMPPFLTQDRDKAAQSGEEAVIEYLLLCRCEYLVHNLSAIPRLVQLSVPDMPETNVDVPTALHRAAAACQRHAATSMSRPAVWLRWAILARDRISGKPVRTWYRLLRGLWIERWNRRIERNSPAGQP
jgi:hypothetical protein